MAPGALQRAERGSVGALGLAFTPPLRALQDLGRLSLLPRGERLGGVSSQEPSQHSRHRASGPVGGPPHAHPGAPRGTAAYLRVLAAGAQASCSGGGEWRRERDGSWR